MIKRINLDDSALNMGKINIIMLFGIIAINCVPFSKMTTDGPRRQTDTPRFPHKILGQWGGSIGDSGWDRGSVRGCQFLNLGLLEARTHRSARVNTPLHPSCKQFHRKSSFALSDITRLFDHLPFSFSELQQLILIMFRRAMIKQQCFASRSFSSNSSNPPTASSFVQRFSSFLVGAGIGFFSTSYLILEELRESNKKFESYLINMEGRIKAVEDRKQKLLGSLQRSLVILIECAIAAIYLSLQQNFEVQRGWSDAPDLYV